MLVKEILKYKLHDFNYSDVDYINSKIMSINLQIFYQSVINTLRAGVRYIRT